MAVRILVMVLMMTEKVAAVWEVMMRMVGVAMEGYRYAY